MPAEVDAVAVCAGVIVEDPDSMEAGNKGAYLSPRRGIDPACIPENRDALERAAMIAAPLMRAGSIEHPDMQSPIPRTGFAGAGRRRRLDGRRDHARCNTGVSR